MSHNPEMKRVNITLEPGQTIKMGEEAKLQLRMVQASEKKSGLANVLVRVPKEWNVYLSCVSVEEIESKKMRKAQREESREDVLPLALSFPQASHPTCDIKVKRKRLSLASTRGPVEELTKRGISDFPFRFYTIIYKRFEGIPTKLTI